MDKHKVFIIHIWRGRIWRGGRGEEREGEKKREEKEGRGGRGERREGKPSFVFLIWSGPKREEKKELRKKTTIKKGGERNMFLRVRGLEIAIPLALINQEKEGKREEEERERKGE